MQKMSMILQQLRRQPVKKEAKKTQSLIMTRLEVDEKTWAQRDMAQLRDETEPFFSGFCKRLACHK
jgi:hypothetical protein